MQEKKGYSKSNNNRIFKYLIIVIIFLAAIYIAGGTTIISDLQGEFLNIITGNLTVSGDLTAKTGRVATFTVAANGSLATSKAQADYVCDGIDDQVEIQTAINALPGSGGKVLLMEGRYNINTPPLNVNKGNVTLEGCGWGTELYYPDNVMTGSAGTVQMRIKAASNKFQMRNLKFNGNQGNQPAGETYGIYMEDTTLGNYRFENLWLKDSYGDGVRLSKNSIISNCLIEGFKEDGVEVGSGGGQIIIGNVIRNGNVPIRLNTGSSSNNTIENVIIANNHIRDVPTDAISILPYSGSGAIKNIQIIGNNIENCDGAAVWARPFESTTIENIFIKNNYIRNCGKAADEIDSIYLYSEHNPIINCKIVGNEIFDSKYNAIHTYYAHQTEIEGNSIINTSGVGIKVVGDNMIISNNLVKDSSSYGIYPSGDYLKIHDNRITGNSNGLHFYGVPNHISIIGNTIFGNTGYSIYSWRDDYNTTDCIISNNILDNEIRLRNTQQIDNLIIKENIFNNGMSFSLGGTDHIIKNNIGFTTENYGTTSAGTEIQVSHGLAWTPNRIIITPLGETNYSYVHDKGASTFNITSEASVAFDWDAVYEP